MRDGSAGPASGVHSPVVSATLGAAQAALGMRAVYLSSMSSDRFTIDRVHGSWPIELPEGLTVPRQESMCTRLLGGAPPATADAANESGYADAALRVRLGITSYAGVPFDGGAGVKRTLCGIDTSRVPVSGEALSVLERLAELLARELGEDGGGEIVIRRGLGGGWRVVPGPVVRRSPDDPAHVAAAGRAGGTAAGGGRAVERGVDDDSRSVTGAVDEGTDDLLSAMVLADLLGGDGDVPQRPVRHATTDDETAALRQTVTQLEHALSARVVVEQAIGVLVERHRLAPRAAFERLRRASRSRGRKVHDLARQVVASAGDPAVPLPPELLARRMPGS